MQSNQLPTPDLNGQNNSSIYNPLLPPDEQKPNKNIIKRYLQEKRILVPIVLIILIPLIFIIFVYRYDIFGLILKQNYSIEVLDSKTLQPLINTKVILRGQTLYTNNYGQVQFKSIKIGKTNIALSSIYYSDSNKNTIVTFTDHNFHIFTLNSSETEVRFSIINKVTQNPINAALIKVSNTSALTNFNGEAVISLPSSKVATPGYITVNNYNDLKISVSADKSNDNAMIPTGKVYYFLNYLGLNSFVSSNIDGSNIKVILPGNNLTTPKNIQKLNNKDSSYIALSMPDTNNKLTLYLYETFKNKLTSIDSSSSGIVINGWTPDNVLVFTHLTNFAIDNSGPKLQAFKVGSNNKVYDLDNSNTNGFDVYSFEQENYNYVYVNNDDNVIFTKFWSGDPQVVKQSSTTISVVSVNNSNQFHKIDPQQKINYSDVYSSRPKVSLTSPNSQNLAFTNSSNGQVSYYTYLNGKSSNVTDIKVKNSIVNPKTNSDFYLSPNNNNQMWSKIDGNTTTINIGSLNGDNPTVIAKFDNSYKPYGWLTNNYILLNKDDTGLYIIPSQGTDNQSKIQKIANFIP